MAAARAEAPTTAASRRRRLARTFRRNTSGGSPAVTNARAFFKGGKTRGRGAIDVRPGLLKNLRTIPGQKDAVDRVFFPAGRSAGHLLQMGSVCGRARSLVERVVRILMVYL